jgi:hypothetical protein
MIYACKRFVKNYPKLVMVVGGIFAAPGAFLCFRAFDGALHPCRR